MMPNQIIRSLYLKSFRSAIKSHPFVGKSVVELRIVVLITTLQIGCFLIKFKINIWHKNEKGYRKNKEKSQQKYIELIGAPCIPIIHMALIFPT